MKNRQKKYIILQLKYKNKEKISFNLILFLKNLLRLFKASITIYNYY